MRPISNRKNLPSSILPRAFSATIGRSPASRN